MTEDRVKEKFQQAILNLAYWSELVWARGVQTQVVIITQNRNGIGTANVYQNGVLQETAMAIGTVATEVNQKTLRFMHAVARGEVRPTEV